MTLPSRRAGALPRMTTALPRRVGPDGGVSRFLCVAAEIPCQRTLPLRDSGEQSRQAAMRSERRCGVGSVHRCALRRTGGVTGGSARDNDVDGDDDGDEDNGFARLPTDVTNGEPPIKKINTTSARHASG
jgi:hypothetical protein